MFCIPREASKVRARLFAGFPRRAHWVRVLGVRHRLSPMVVTYSESWSFGGVPSTLAVAVARGDLTEMKQILADPSLWSEEEHYCLDIAMNKKNPEMVSLLIARGIGDEITIESALFWAARSDNVDLVDQIVAKCPALIARDRPHHILDRAVRDNRVALVTRLLALDPALTARDESCVIAARSGHDDVLNLVLSNDLTLASGSDALHEAASAGHESTVALLLAKRSQLIHAVDFDKRTALHHAAERGHLNIVRLLLDCKPGMVAMTDRKGCTALHLAAEKGYLDIARQLLDREPEVIAMVDSLGSTALDLAAEGRHLDIVKHLLDRKPDLVDTKEGSTALHSAARSGSIEVIDYLLERNPQLSDVLDTFGQNALHVAAAEGHSEVFLKLLAQNPRSIDLISPEKENTLIFAVSGGAPQVLEAILSLRPEFACWADMYGNTILHHMCLIRDKMVQARLESCLERIWQLNPSALHAANEFLSTPLVCSANSTPEWGTEFFKRKLSWDELIQGIDRASTYSYSSLPEKARILRAFAEEQCELGLSSVLFIPGVIAVVKDYFFAQAGLEEGAVRLRVQDEKCPKEGGETSLSLVTEPEQTNNTSRKRKMDGESGSP